MPLGRACTERRAVDNLKPRSDVGSVRGIAVMGAGVDVDERVGLSRDLVEEPVTAFLGDGVGFGGGPVGR